MTTPPKARRFHTDRAGSSSRSGSEPGDHAAGPFKAEGAASGPESARPAPEAQDSIGVRVSKREPAGSVPTPQPLNSSSEGKTPTAEEMMAPSPTDDGFGDLKFPTAEPTENDQPQQPDAEAKADDPELEAKLAAIRAENLTERQLRIAHRIALLHQIPVSSELEAVLRLRERGIDPSHRSAVGRILSAEGAKAQSAPSPNAPAVVIKAPPVPAPMGLKPGPGLPSREEMTEERRAAEIFRIQRDIAKRRRKRLALLFLRLSFFVFLPTAIAAWYYFSVATPLYSTETQFQIQQATAPGASDAGGLFSGTQMAMNPDSVAVQSYLTSRDAMLRLDNDLGFKRVFQDPAIDPVQRLAPDASNEAAYRVYEKSVKIGYDPTEGMINMKVIAPDPMLSQEFSLALIAYAEGQVDQMTARLRGDQMQGAQESYADAEDNVLKAQRRVQDLQQKLGVLDPAAEGGVVMQQIAQLEVQMNNKQLELGNLLANPRPQQSRVDNLDGEIARIQKMIDQTRLQLTQGNDGRSSLAAISGELRIAVGDLETRQELLAQSAEQLEAARVEANKQVRYLSMSVAPIPPDEPSYPKAFQNTIVAFLIFSGIYLMLSLTASILREQVSS